MKYDDEGGLVFDSKAEYLSYRDMLATKYKRIPVNSVGRWMEAYIQVGIPRMVQRIGEAFMTTRTAYDSTTPQNIPTDAQIVGFYPHAWGTDVSHVPHAILVRIDNHGDHADDCHMLDVENGAATIQTAHEWVQSWHKLHPAGMATANGFIRKPIIYISESSVAALKSALSGMDFDLWVAWWGVGPTEIPGAMAHQYTDRGPNGENYDVSVVWDDSWGHQPITPIPAPVRAPHPVPAPVVDKAFVTWYVVASGTYGGRTVESTDGGVTWR